MFTIQTIQAGHDHIDRLFKERFPAYGLPERPAQVELCHRMLDAMCCSKIALCEAGTGIGKTYAYLVAGYEFFRCRAKDGLPSQPVLISTSSIALQKAIMTEYLPFLSRVLMEEGSMEEPLKAVIRKGKSHYVCDRQLEERLHTANLSHMNQDRVIELQSLRGRLDLDETEHLNNYDLSRVCVPQICACRDRDCRYYRYLTRCKSPRIVFQICNHNLLIADAIRRSRNQAPILPNASALVIDEAHKLPETARQMFGVTLSAQQIKDLLFSLKNERYVLAYENLRDASKPLLSLMSEPPAGRYRIGAYLKPLQPIRKILFAIRKHLYNLVTPETRLLLCQLCDTVSQLCNHSSNFMVYLAEDDAGGCLLCGTPPDLAFKLQNALWNLKRSAILTSGTLAVGDSFESFEEVTGLETDDRVTEYIAPSPYNYRENCLLYFPEKPPHLQETKVSVYYNLLTKQISRLLKASHGHALILFNSYAAMAAVKSRLEWSDLPFPVFAMDKNALYTVEAFKETPGSVLLAAGPAWEGMDFPGDGVSMLIIPRLPFDYPDTQKEQEREKYPSLKAYIDAVAVPNMQIKLRQGFGRAIRGETDTCVIAILDERAVPDGKYHPQIMAALPEMTATNNLALTKVFLLQRKDDAYWQEPKQ